MIDLIDPLLGAGVISSIWGDPRPHLDTYHYGIDVRAAIGTPVYAVATGVVARVDPVNDSSAGKNVVIRSSSGGATFHHRYLHLDSVAAIKRGAVIGRGALVGTVGNTAAENSAPHLHFDLFGDGEMLSRYIARYGLPYRGFPARRNWGTQFPAEPFVPGPYLSSAAERAAKRGTPLYSKPATRPPAILVSHPAPSAPLRSQGSFLLVVGVAGVVAGGLYLSSVLAGRR